ncbi:endonuclease/exonuclease/phosphatase family protein [Rasiella sp. SM2506]|uniref:endonuclease/exonuclease/phosphatase family protein n=1 Tax=Rasiella sp. SM2506 TaxID=3423914 RepID=UPI003D78FFBE
MKALQKLKKIFSLKQVKIKLLKNLGFFGKVLFWINSIVAFLLLISFFLPYISPEKFPNLSLLSLVVLPLLWLNAFFLVYWILRRKRMFLLPAITLVLAYFIFNPFYKFSSEGEVEAWQKKLSVVSYNVRLFNLYEDQGNVDETSTVLSEILKTEKPDIVCLQEYYEKNTVDFSDYPYKYTHFGKKNHKLGHAIFSKYKLVTTGAFDFEDTFNNTLYADVVVGKDTVRVYNLHLQSFGIKPSVGELQEEDKTRVRNRLSSAFAKQEQQVKKIVAHKAQSKYPTLLMGDFNNTPFSFVYQLLGATMNDAFLERGNGLGTTFTFDVFPMRIDYIFTSEEFEVLNFERIDTTFSDHYPIKATLTWQ